MTMLISALASPIAAKLNGVPVTCTHQCIGFTSAEFGAAVAKLQAVIAQQAADEAAEAAAAEASGN